MDSASGKKLGRTALLSAAVAAWQIYEIATAVEVPSTAVRVLHYTLLTMALAACIGSTALYLKNAGG